MEKKLQKLTKLQMLELLKRLHSYGSLVMSFSPEDAFDRGYFAAYINVKTRFVEIIDEYLAEKSK